jgi:hypothetical protein
VTASSGVAPLGVTTMADYLAGTGWEPTGQTWRGARIWARDGTEVLLPVREDLGDNPDRLREAVAVVAEVEGREPASVVRSVRLSAFDAVSHRPRRDAPLPLPVGVSTVAGLQALVRAAARGAVEGRHTRFPGSAPPAVTALIRRSLLDAESAEMSVLVPAGALDDAGGATGRDVVTELRDAVAAVAAAAGETLDVGSMVRAGVSAELCTALGDLAGEQRREPFALAIGWGAGTPGAPGPRRVEFEAEAGAWMRAAATRLRRATVTGPGVARGRVDGLHDEAGTRDRWRVRVRGELAVDGPSASRATTWVRLPDPESYDLLVEAYRDGRHIAVSGQLTTRDGRVELRVPAGGTGIGNDEEREDEGGR